MGRTEDPKKPKKPGDSADSVDYSADDDDLYLAPTSASSAREAGRLPTTASENVSHLLGKIALPKPKALAEEYLPCEFAEWVVTVQFPGKPRLKPKTVEALFDADWCNKFGAFCGFGRDADSGTWAFLVSADGPKAVTDLKFAWELVGGDGGKPTAAMYAKRFAELARKLKKFGEPQIDCSLAPVEAVKRSKNLEELKEEFDHSAVLVLKAERGTRFEGKAIWDVMLCLGLEWGDMDCFHWENPSEEGDSYFFSVETSTPPGYFLPEEIAAGKLAVDDLVFTFSVPRSLAPAPVFDGMAKAVEYCRSRLQGTILDEDGGKANLAAIRSRIIDTENRMAAAGIKPGSGDALRLF